MSTTDSLNGTGFSNNGIADALREQLDEPRPSNGHGQRFKAKPCATCGQTIENPSGPRTKYHDDCKPTGRASGNGKAQQSEQAEQAGKKAAAPKRKRRAPARRRPAARPTPAATLAARLTADCDQELQRLDGELDRLEKGIAAMREEQAKLNADRAQVARVQQALVA